VGTAWGRLDRGIPPLSDGGSYGLLGDNGRAYRIQDRSNGYAGACARRILPTGAQAKRRPCRKAIELLEEFPRGAELTEAYVRHARILIVEREYDRAIRWALKALHLADQIGDVRARILALHRVGSATLLMGDDQGEATLRKALSLALESNLPVEASGVYIALASAWVERYELDRAEPYLTESIAYADEHQLGGFLTGRVKTAYPLKGNSTIDAGRNVAGYCNLASTLSSSISLRLYGNCNSTSFEGYYTIYYTGTKNLARGTFRLTRKTDSKASGLSAADISASAQVACVKSNARCLTGCPRGDTDVEYLCANHCRTKFLACRGKASKILSDSDSE